MHFHHWPSMTSHNAKPKLFFMIPSCLQNQYNLDDSYTIPSIVVACGTTLAISETQLRCALKKHFLEEFNLGDQTVGNQTFKSSLLENPLTFHLTAKTCSPSHKADHENQLILILSEHLVLYRRNQHSRKTALCLKPQSASVPDDLSSFCSFSIPPHPHPLFPHCVFITRFSAFQ